jgi:hypothetical protein
MPHDDFAFEPQKGLPERLPKTEALLWQGRPQTWALLREAYGLRWIGFYFALIVVWRAADGWLSGGLMASLAVAIPYGILGLLALALLALLAWVAARSTVYTVTTARVVMRIGAALTITLNLPYRQIANASLALRNDGTGTIAFETVGDTQLSAMILWPHMRPWRLKRTQPALRCIQDARRVSDLIAEAASSRVNEPKVTIPRSSTAPISIPAPMPRSVRTAVPAR